MSLLSSIFKGVTKGIAKVTGIDKVASAAGIRSSLLGNKAAGAAKAITNMPMVGSGGIPTAAASVLTTVKGALPSLAGGALASVVTGGKNAIKAAGGLPTIGREVAIGAGLTLAGGMLFDQSGQPVGRLRSKRINPMNVKAARRAIRRIKGVRKLLMSIDKNLPRRK